MSEVKQVIRQPLQANNVKKNTFIILKNRPCKVVEVKTSKTGKHGHAKANITGVCVLTGQKCNEVHPASHNLVEFKPEKIEYMVMDVADGESREIHALDGDSSQVTFNYYPDRELCVGKDIVAAYKAAGGQVDINMTVVRAPVQIGDNDFRDEELIESFKVLKEQA